MKLFDKIKTILFEEEEVDVPVIKKEEPKEEVKEETVVEEVPTEVSENKEA